MKFLMILLTVFSISSVEGQIVRRTFRLDAVDSTQPQPSSNGVSQILISRGRVFLATDNGLNITTDGGSTFQTDFGNNSPTGLSVSAVAVKGDTIVTAISTTTEQNGESVATGEGFYASMDDGQSCNKQSQSTDSTSDTSVVFGINTLRALPIQTTAENITYSLVFHKGYLYSAEWGGGLRRTDDLGKTWQRVVLPPDYLDYINGDSSYSFQLSVQTNDKYNTNEANLNQEAFSLYSDGDSVLYVGTAGGIDKTTDNGHSWYKYDHANTSSGISGNFVVYLAGQNSGTVHYIWGATVVANGQTEKSALSYTTDCGLTWRHILDGHFFHGMAFHDSTVVYGVSDDGLFRTADFGQSSQVITNIYDPTTTQSILSQSFYAVAVGGDSVWIGSGDGTAVGIDKGTGFDFNRWRVIKASTSKSLSGNPTYFYPNPFSPNNYVGRVHYVIKNAGSQVTIRIFDFSMHIVRTLLQNATRGPIPGQDFNEEAWDCKGIQGRLVDNGVYFFSVVVNGGSPQWGKIMVIR